MSETARPISAVGRLPKEGPDLPPCAYREPRDGIDYRCEAAGGAIVSAHDCRACSIPEAVGHKDACLYLTPLRHEGEARYACRWFFSAATEPLVDDWRKLCFCSYWFPRGPDERHVMMLTRERRGYYLKVVRGEAPRRVTRASIPSTRAQREPPRRRSPLMWLRMLTHRLRHPMLRA